MATTLIGQYNASFNVSDFLNRVTIAIDAAAQAIAGEANTTTNHSNRVALAKAVANAPQSYAQQFAFLIGAQGIDDSSTDTAINNMVSSVWNTMAGVP